jgi:hypothetical protein
MAGFDGLWRGKSQVDLNSQTPWFFHMYIQVILFMQEIKLKKGMYYQYFTSIFYNISIQLSNISMCSTPSDRK